MIDEARLRQYARAGALEVARGIIAEFPDILPELNAAAKPEPRKKLVGHVTRAGDFRPIKKTKKKRVISAEGRKRISDAQKARWAKRRAK